MGKRLLIEEERTQRQQTIAEWLPAQKSWDSRAHSIVYTKLSRLENAPFANVLELSHKNPYPHKQSATEFIMSRIYVPACLGHRSDTKTKQ